jgi:cytoplasmic tRNA 2-thiolation protein 2
MRLTGIGGTQWVWTPRQHPTLPQACSMRVRLDQPGRASTPSLTPDPDLLISLSFSSDSSTPAEKLRSYLASLPTQTSLHSSIQNLIRLLLLYTAGSTDSSHLLLGTSLTSLAISLISSISQGGGFNVREELQEEWTTDGKAVRVVRPLRDIGMKECATYAWWTRLTIVGKEKWLNSRQGINGLTKGIFHSFLFFIFYYFIIGTRLFD